MWIDLEFAGRPRIIGTAVFGGPGGALLIDPGPASSLPALERGLEAHGLRLDAVTHILLTHIHVDHAGATGAIVERRPDIRVLVHERGAVHMSNPARLLDSATRLFGESVMQSYGPMRAVPEASLEPLSGGERIRAAGVEIDVAYTPGHASHHVSYFERSSGVAFVGDTAGVRLEGGCVMAPTPPPDVDVERWLDSLHRIRAWRPDALVLTHFGPVTAVDEHIGSLRETLSALVELARALLAAPGTGEDRLRRFIDYVHGVQYREMTPAQLAVYDFVMPLDVLWLGLARYWSRKGVVAAG